MDIDLTKWKKEILCIHVEMPNPYCDSEKKPFLRLSYDLSDDFTDEQVRNIKNFVNEVNVRFPGIKLSVSGTGYVSKEYLEATNDTSEK